MALPISTVFTESTVNEAVAVIAQGDPVQCAEGITRRERTRRDRD